MALLEAASEREMPGREDARAVARCLRIGQGLPPFSPGPDIAFRGEDGSPGILRRQSQTVGEARSQGPWVHRIYYAFLLKSSS